MSREGFYGRRMVPEYLIKKLEKGPVKLKDITNITELTDDQINSLEAGDIVLKKTSNQYHAYIVSYKEDKVGICLTYTDASCIETVSYDYTANHWVYNSTDITLMEEKQDKLTAGTGIEIDSDNVISATGGQLYMHQLRAYLSDGNNEVQVGFNLISKKSTAITLNDLITNYNNFIFQTSYGNGDENSTYAGNSGPSISINFHSNYIDGYISYISNGDLETQYYEFTIDDPDTDIEVTDNQILPLF